MNNATLLRDLRHRRQRPPLRGDRRRHPGAPRDRGRRGGSAAATSARSASPSPSTSAWSSSGSAPRRWSTGSGSSRATATRRPPRAGSCTSTSTTRGAGAARSSPTARTRSGPRSTPLLPLGGESGTVGIARPGDRARVRVARRASTVRCGTVGAGPDIGYCSGVVLVLIIVIAMLVILVARRRRRRLRRLPAPRRARCPPCRGSVRRWARPSRPADTRSSPEDFYESSEHRCRR